MRRAVVTGIGLVSPLGSDPAKFWDRIAGGVSGVRSIQQFDAARYTCQIAGEVIEYDPNDFFSSKEQRRTEPHSQFAIAAARHAVQDAGLDTGSGDPYRRGCVVGTGIGGLQTLERQYQILIDQGPERHSPFMIPQMICNMSAGLIAIDHNMKGPNFAPVSACSSAAHSIGEALRLIQRDDVDIMACGGTEAAVCPLGVGGFCAMRAMSTRNDAPQEASRPFDADRDGFVMGEGAAILILEELEHARKRDARIYCEVVGFGMTCDAAHMTAPSEGGEGAARAITNAMADGGVTSADIDYINAHGTSTSLNDKGETAAIKRALGEHDARRTMISSSKSMTGHLLGAAAGVEAIVCALALTHQVAPPTINYQTPDPECDLDYVPNTARETRLDVCINTSNGFGGHNAALVLKKI
jgi:3-oxoacyl-[acyl-carrier-protein] synthase II